MLCIQEKVAICLEIDVPHLIYLNISSAQLIETALLCFIRLLQPLEYVSFILPGTANTSRLYELAIAEVTKAPPSQQIRQPQYNRKEQLQYDFLLRNFLDELYLEKYIQLLRLLLFFIMSIAILRC